MEQYKIENMDNKCINIGGKYYNRIHEKHINSYGNEGADNIAVNVKKYSRIFKIKFQKIQTIIHFWLEKSNLVKLQIWNYSLLSLLIMVIIF